MSTEVYYYKVREICVLKALREQLRCREIWVVGSRRYRDPEEDLPQDLEERRAAYYEDLGAPLDPKVFTASLREEMTRHLKTLDEEILSNPRVKILPKKVGYRISSSPPRAPSGAGKLGYAQARGYPAVVWYKSAGCAQGDGPASEPHAVPPEWDRAKATLQRRLLLCLFGLGTNTGIKSMAIEREDEYKDLYYVRRRFISIEGLRQAISQVVNATLAVRVPQVCGKATTACASDSRQFWAWDQNLLTEWHLRYGATP